MTVMLIIEVGMLAAQESTQFFDMRTDTASDEHAESESVQRPRRPFLRWTRSHARRLDNRDGAS
jgi:hypothetical protein